MVSPKHDCQCMLMPLTAEHSQLMLQNLESGWGSMGSKDPHSISHRWSHDATTAETCCRVLKELSAFGCIWAFAVVKCFVPISLVSIAVGMFTSSLLVIVGVFLHVFYSNVFYTSCTALGCFGSLLAFTFLTHMPFARLWSMFSIR